MPTPSEPCRSGRLDLTYTAGGADPRELCLRAGATVTLTLEGPPGYAWSAAESSDPAVVAVTAAAAGGTGTAEITALRPGRAVVSAAISFTGDRFGPPTRLWRLPLLVEPADDPGGLSR